MERLRAQHTLLLRGIANRLEGEFGEHFTKDTLQHYVDDSYHDLASRSKVLTHIPAFVERFSRQRLKALAKNGGYIEDHLPDVLFICERNDGSSQMAAAMFRARAGDLATVHSAGSAPAAELLEEAVHVLHEIGIELLEEFPKPITEEIEQAADVIVTLDAHDDIVVVDDKQYSACRLPARHDGGLDGYRQLRDEIDQHVAELFESIVPKAPPRPHQAFDAELEELENRTRAMGERVTDITQATVDLPDPDSPTRPYVSPW